MLRIIMPCVLLIIGLLFKLKVYRIIAWCWKLRQSKFDLKSMTSSETNAVGLKQILLMIKAAKHSYWLLNLVYLKYGTSECKQGI